MPSLLPAIMTTWVKHGTAYGTKACAIGGAKTALLALEQEDGNRFSGNKIASLGQREVSFAFHEKQIEQAQNELSQAKERLDNITLIERMTGKRGAYEADIKNKEMTLEAQNQLRRSNAKSQLLKTLALQQR